MLGVSPAFELAGKGSILLSDHDPSQGRKKMLFFYIKSLLQLSLQVFEMLIVSSSSSGGRYSVKRKAATCLSDTKVADVNLT